MQLPQPYLYTSQRMIAMVDRPQMAPREGPIADAVYGYHTLWAAEVPFIPAPLDKGEGRFEQNTSLRITRVLERQVRFLYDLAQSRDHHSTFEMRLVSWPQAGGYSKVGIVFFGKVFHQEEQISRQLALGLWDKFSAIFPHEAPLSYPLVPVKETVDPTYPQSHSFAEWYEPIPFQQLTKPQNIVELRKYEDWPTVRGVGGAMYARDYIPHPFVAALDYTAMARLFETMARQRELCMVSITLRPQRLTDQEIIILHELASWYQRAAQGEIMIDNPLIEVLHDLQSDLFASYVRSRSELGLKVYENLVREQRSLFLVRLQVIGAPIAQEDLIEALGSEVMANAGNAYPSRWTRVEPTTQDLRWSRFNLQWLEFVRWGITPQIQQYLPIVRLRQLATVQEAAGAFRLPVAPSEGGLAGLEISDEPFTTQGYTPETGKSIYVGMMQDRGAPTEIALGLPLQNLHRPTLLLGEQASSRELVMQKLFTGLQAQNIPWIIIRGEEALNSSSPYPQTLRRIEINALYPNRKLPIQPFSPPVGVAFTTFIDSLTRVLTAAYALNSSASIVLRGAILKTYTDNGWAENTRGQTIDLTDLATHIDTMAQSPETPMEIGTLLRTRCVLPLRDMAVTVMPLLDTTVEADLWSEPTSIEISWLGNDIHAQVLQGCLWSWLALTLTTKKVDALTNLRGLVLLEDAHALFTAPVGEQQATSPMLSLILALSRAYIGTLLIDSRPDFFNADFINKAGATIITKSVSSTLQKHAAALLNVSDRQQARACKLKEREAVVALNGSEPALLAL